MSKIHTPKILVLALTAAFVVIGCRDQLGPDITRTADLAFVPVFESARAGLVPVTTARIVATLQSSGAVLTDSVIDIADQDSVDIGLIVPVSSPDDIFLITLALVGLQNDTVFRGGPIEVPADGGEEPSVTPIELLYTGVGASADSVVILGTPPTLFTGSSFTFQAVAYEGDTIVPGTPVAWSSPDAAQATVPDYTVGQVVAAASRGNARIVAELLNGAADTATVLVQPAPSAATVPGGNDQSGEVALPLPGPVTVQVLGADGLPIQDAIVRFAGDGFFSPDTGVTDADGNVQTLWTLGAVAGPQAAVATVDDLPAGSVRTGNVSQTGNMLDHVSVGIVATGLAGPPTQLGFSVQPVDTIAGDPVPVAVAVLDSLNNLVLPDNGRAVMLSIVSGTGTAGASLGGTNPGITASGVAAFNDITLDSLGTDYQLEAAATNLFPDTSVSFTVRAGVVSTVTMAPASDTLEALDATTTLVATGRDVQGNVLPGLTFVWSSSDSSVAVPDADGNVTAIGNGTATITASSGGVSGSASITVLQRAASVVVSPALDTLSVLADTTRFTATVRDANGNIIANASVTWSLGDSSVASINAVGLATALGNGTTSVVATIDGIPGAATLVVDLIGGAGVHWTNVSGGDWSNPANWSTGVVPTSTDTVYIDLPGTYTVNLDVTATIEFLHMGATGAQTLSISGNVLSVNTGGIWTENTTLDMSGGSVRGTGGIVTSGTVNWTGGEFGNTGNGTLLVDQNGTLNIAGGTKTLRAYNLALDGTGTWSAGTIQSGSAGALIVGSNGVLDIQGDLTFTYNLGGTVSRLDNAGTITRTTTTGVTQLNVQVNNVGTLNAQTGQLRLTQGGTSSGAFSVGSGGVIDFGGGTHTLVAGSDVGGAGEVRFSGGTTTIGGDYTASNLTNVTGGIVQFSSGITSTTANLAFSGGRIEGTGLFSVSGTLDWTGGEFGNIGSGTTRLESTGTFSIGGGTKTLRTYELALDGTGVWTAGTIQSGSDGILSVESNGTLDIQGDVTMTYNLGGNASRINNTGTITRTVGTGTAQLNVAVNNDGTVTSQSGMLRLTQGGAGDGAYTATSGATVDFGGGTHNLGANSNVDGAGEIRFSSGTTIVAGTYTVTGQMNVVGGIAQFGAGVAATTNSLDLSSGRVEGDGVLTVGSTLTWTGGEFGNVGAGTTQLASAGTYSIAGGTKTLRSHTLALFGNGTWTAGTIQSGTNAVFLVASPGSLDIQGDITMTYNLGGGTPRFDNSGTVTRSVGTGTVSLNIPFNNVDPSSIVDVQTGVISLTQGGTWNGGVTLASSAFLDFAAGTHELADGFNVTGVSPARITGGTVSILASRLASFDQLTVSGGTITGAGFIDVVDGFIWSGGSLDGAQLGGMMRLQPTTIASFEGGTKNLRRSFESPGTVTWTAGTIQTGAGAVFDNQGIFDIQGDLTFTYNLGGGTTQFNNTGTVVRSAGAGTAALNVAFNNVAPTSTVDVQTGTLNVSQNSTWDGTITLASGTSFDFVAGAHVLNNGFTVAGPAPARILGGTVSIGADLTATFDELNIEGGTLTGAGAVDVATELIWTGGNMEDADNGGVTRLGTGAVASFTTGTKNLRRVLENDGIIVWSGGSIQTGSGGVLENRGAFEIQGDLTYTYNLGGTTPSIENSGILARTSGAGTTSLNVDVVNQSGGLIDLQTGTVRLTQGYSDVPGSGIQGNGVLDLTSASFTTIAADIGPGVSPGVLGLIGNYTQNAAARLVIEIGGPTPGSGTGFHDQFNVSGTADLPGTMDVTLVDGYTPVLGDRYTVATFSSATSGFGSGIVLPVLAGNLSLDTRFTPTSTEIGVRQAAGLGISPAHLAVNPATDSIYVVQASSNQLVVFDVATGAVAGQPFPVLGASNLSHVDVNEVLNKIYIVDGVEIGVNVLDGSDRSVLTQHTVGQSPQTLAWHRGTDSVYVMALVPGVSGPGLYVLDGTSPFDSVYNQSTTLLGQPGSGAGFVAVDEQNDRVFAGLDNGFLVRLQASTKTIIDSVPVGSAPGGIAVNRITRMVYVADAADNSVTVIDDSQPAGSAVVAVIPTVGANPIYVDVDEGNDMVFVGDQSGVTVIDGATNTVRTFIPNTPTSDNQVVFHMGRGLLYFTNSAGQTITGTRP